MPTNAIAADQERLSLQILKRQKGMIGQAAMEKGYSSLGEYVRVLIQTGLEVEDKRLAERYQAARSQRYARNISMVVTTSIVLWQSIISNQDMVRKLPSARLARNGKEEVQV